MGQPEYSEQIIWFVGPAIKMDTTSHVAATDESHGDHVTYFVVESSKDHHHRHR